MDAQRLVLGVATGLGLIMGTASMRAHGAEEVLLTPAWKVGDVRRYERVKTRAKTVAGKTTRTSGQGPVEVKVVEAGPEGWVIAWTNGDTRPGDPKGVVDPNSAAIAKVVEGMRTELVISPEVKITGVRNWQDLKKTFTKLVDATVEAQRKGGVGEADLAQVRQGMEGMFTTREGVERLATAEAMLFFFPFGRAYPGVGKAVEIDDTLASPLGGPPIPSRGTWTLTSHDKVKGRAVVEWTQETDPEATARAIVEALKRFAPGPGRAQPKAEALKDLRVSDRAEFVIDLKGGWIERFSHTRTTTLGGATQADTLSMSLLAR